MQYLQTKAECSSYIFLGIMNVSSDPYNTYHLKKAARRTTIIMECCFGVACTYYKKTYSILDLLNYIFEEVQSMPNWKMAHIMRIQSHIILVGMQYITTKTFHNSVHHSDIPSTNLCMWIITEVFAEWREMTLIYPRCWKWGWWLSEVFYCPYTLNRATSRSTVCIDAVLSSYGRMHLMTRLMMNPHRPVQAGRMRFHQCDVKRCRLLPRC